MANLHAEQNKAIVLEAFDTLFNRRDYAAAERFWAADYIQHSADVAPGRAGLFDLVKESPDSLTYEPGLVMAEDDLVIIHGRFCALEEALCWETVNVLRLDDAIIVEHWDLMQSKEKIAFTSYPKRKRA